MVRKSNADTYGLGPLNGHAVGRILKEAVRRATVAIRNERLVFEAHTKKGHSDNMKEVFTSADLKAQEIYLRTFHECFPFCGVIGEENSLSIKPKKGCSVYFTVDPLDGTNAYVRRQSDGVGTMVAMVYKGKVISAYVGDINTEEVYGYRPGSNKVHRITRLDTFETLSNKGQGDLSKTYALLRDPADQYSKGTIAILSRFKNYEVTGSSIGIWMAKLWKGEVGALFLKPGWETPWDSTPIIGISLKLGYVFLRQTAKGSWKKYNPILPTEKYRRVHDTIVVHKDDLKFLGL